MKKKLEIILFGNCRDCPYKSFWNNDDKELTVDWTCSEHLFTVIPNKMEFPEWCPLESVE